MTTFVAPPEASYFDPRLLQLPNNSYYTEALQLPEITTPDYSPTPITPDSTLSIFSSTSPSRAFSTPRTVSSSDAKSPRRRLSCCGKDFHSPRDLDRHFNSFHGSERLKCRCGKLNSRKDNHKRHVSKCRLPTVTSYRCSCGREDHIKDKHLSHIKKWSANKVCEHQGESSSDFISTFLKTTNSGETNTICS
ncbi:hypothetical protein QBC38DRAFT_487641 [Podospora fimiseda]|uniref:C2H2-type domain-containing protein n=1 Tax=Podospora fimiseda TaxID=252190 RepID=A0AAN7BHU3_9PEZI|nr:hypothetical protein QBC38DRAFT_487641 [Podospora fimiseda]